MLPIRACWMDIRTVRMCRQPQAVAVGINGGPLLVLHAAGRQPRDELERPS